MNRLQFQQVETLFEAAVGYDAPARQMFLDRIAREHSREIRDHVERLLDRDRSDTRWTDFGSSMAAPLATPEPEPEGTVIDRFRLIERLGIGGHGEVYLAEQLHPVQRLVALKMVRLGAATDQVIERFRAEQQALAVMSHPGIAAVYEAGLADQGRLFFAMEYVQGQPIDAYADEKRLTVRERLGLFLKVCQAVQHAHQKGLIHRDLKPTNILVAERDGVATPVLIDFGIAVATASVDRDDTSQAAIGTPAYMSPEQARADSHDIDTRTDIYAMGIVLYELLVGRTPIDMLAPAGASLAEIRRCIVDGRAPEPATLLMQNAELATTAAMSRGCSARHLQRQVAGDLNAIVCRAISHDRSLRYQTVETLAADIDDYLQHRPIAARPSNTAERIHLFMRRHKVAVGVTVALWSIVVIGVIGITLAMLRAEQAARETLALNSFLTDLLTSSRPLEKGSTVSFVEVLEGGSAMAADRFAAYPQQEGEIRYLIGNTYYSLGMYREARVELDRALAMLRTSLGMKHSRTLHCAHLLAMANASLRRLDQAQALAEEILEHTAAEPMSALSLGAQRVLCDVLIERGKYAEAEQNLRALIQHIDAELGTHHLEAYNARMSLVQVLRRQTMARPDSDPHPAPFEEEVAILRETVELQRARFGNEDAYPLLSSQLKLGMVLLEQKHYAEAQQIVEAVLPKIRERFGTTHWMFGEATSGLAEILYAQGDYQGAADSYLMALQAWRTVYPERHPIALGSTTDAMPYLDAAGRAEDGLREARYLYASINEIFGPADLITLQARAWLARFCSLSGLLDEADEHFAGLSTHADALHNEATGRYISLFHAGHLARRGQFAEAEAELLQLSERQGGVSVGVHADYPDNIARMFIELYTAWGKPEKVREYQQIVETIWSPLD